jgi:tRNA threonylcarbamoyladenosine dehydratase
LRLFSLGCRGVTDIRLVDFDYVTLSSLNRHATATLADVGTPKVNCIERTLKQISRWVQVDARVDIWRKDQGGKHLEDADWVIGASNIFRLSVSTLKNVKLDAIDNITTKVDLLKYCHDHKVKVQAFLVARNVFHLCFIGLFLDGCRSEIRPNTCSN